MKYIMALLIASTLPFVAHADGYAWSYGNNDYSLTFNVGDNLSKKPKCNYKGNSNLPLSFGKAISISRNYLIQEIDPEGKWVFDNLIIKLVESSISNECVYIVEFINVNIKPKKGSRNNRMLVGVYTDGEIVKHNKY